MLIKASQCLRSNAAWGHARGNPKGSRITRAPAQRQKLRLTGGIKRRMPLPSTKLPDQNRTVKISSK